jgi:hypothetical protein
MAKLMNTDMLLDTLNDAYLVLLGALGASETELVYLFQRATMQVDCGTAQEQMRYLLHRVLDRADAVEMIFRPLNLVWHRLQEIKSCGAVRTERVVTAASVLSVALLIASAIMWWKLGLRPALLVWVMLPCFMFHQGISCVAFLLLIGSSNALVAILSETVGEVLALAV